MKVLLASKSEYRWLRGWLIVAAIFLIIFILNGNSIPLIFSVYCFCMATWDYRALRRRQRV